MAWFGLKGIVKWTILLPRPLFHFEETLFQGNYFFKKSQELNINTPGLYLLYVLLTGSFYANSMTYVVCKFVY